MFTCISSREFYTRFDGKVWANNGPGKFNWLPFSFFITHKCLFLGAITRVLRTICHVNDLSEMTPEKCSGFQVYPPRKFYPIPWWNWELYFDTDKFNKTIDMIKDSIIIHLWNKLSKNRKLKVNTKAVYGVVADMYCPKVYRSCGEYF